MAYFGDNAEKLSIRESAVPNGGLRRGQVGALHALMAHFIERSEPAIVSLPTGYGKTAVLTSACFLLRANRVLVVTPTNALRGQMAKAFRTMETLLRLKALPEVMAAEGPRVKTLEERVTSPDGWREFEAYDVVVCTPGSASPELDGVPLPPPDLFDLVLVDEGHHSPARTWAAFIRATPSAKHVLLSATPFRRDQRQLPGRLVFYYSLRRAVEEQAFGRVIFTPVAVDQGALPAARDDALIQTAVAIYRRDQAAGFEHRLLARAARVQDAELLAEKYIAAGLRVEAVSSRKSRSQIQDVEARLIGGELDGVVCVDMFGEGYDFPKFKIAVLHSAHKSLVPTLQFIGRFARTNDMKTGDATFLAVPTDVNAESSGLYADGVDWDVLLAEVVEARQALTLKERAVLQAFAQTGRPSADYEQVNLGALRLGQHIALYRANTEPNFEPIPDSVRSLQVTNVWLSEERTTAVLLAKSVKSPGWYGEEHLVDAAHECFVFRYFPDSRLVFITATERSARFYAELLDIYVGGAAVPLALEELRKVLHGMTDQEFYSVGLRSTSPSAPTESYRIVAGTNADRGIRDSDATNFAQGHFMGRGTVEGETEIIGASSSGRVWSTGRLTLPELMNWTDALHTRITAEHVAIGRSGLDLLSVGETLRAFPQTTRLAHWPKGAFRDAPRVTLIDGDKQTNCCLLDMEISNIEVVADGASMTFDIGLDGVAASVRYRLQQSPSFESVTEEPRITVLLSDGSQQSISEWLEDHGLVFFTADLDHFYRATLTRRKVSTELRPDSLRAHDWTRCETTVEFDSANPNRRTVQRHLQDHLLALPSLQFLVYDHRSGEAADFIVGIEDNGGLRVELYHCKGAGGNASGERVDDAYELAGQAVKSAHFQTKNAIRAHIRRRTEQVPGRGSSPMLRGTREAALALIDATAPIDMKLHVYAVQPGISAAAVADRLKVVMGAANDSLRAQGVGLTWLVSA